MRPAPSGVQWLCLPEPRRIVLHVGQGGPQSRPCPGRGVLAPDRQDPDATAYVCADSVTTTANAVSCFHACPDARANLFADDSADPGAESVDPSANAISRTHSGPDAMADRRANDSADVGATSVDPGANTDSGTDGGLDAAAGFHADGDASSHRFSNASGRGTSLRCGCATDIDPNRGSTVDVASFNGS
mmetsp:Transcript_79333/g.220681  ORF Transcript_79333/g.220681 Transcript_79333/m.220681 type:complete len:189 (-) Transcript_79333:534-1100(-)